MHAAAALLAAILGQVGVEPAGPQLRRVDEGISDRDPLGASLKIPISDLRVPTGFEGVYQVQSAEGHDLFVRRSGAIWAVFPRGVYSRSNGRTLVQMPPGMSFSIGVPRALRTPDPQTDPQRDALAPEQRGVEPSLRRSAERERPPGAARLELASAHQAPAPRREARQAQRLDHSTTDVSTEAPPESPPDPRIRRDPGASTAAEGSAAPPSSPRALQPSRFILSASADQEVAATPLALRVAPLPRFVTDELYRRNRLAGLLERHRGHAAAASSVPLPAATPPEAR